MSFATTARILQIFSILAGLYVLVSPSLAVVAAIFNVNQMDLGFMTLYVNEVSSWWRALLSLIPNGIVAVGLWQLAQFGKLLTAGGYFTIALSDCLKRASVLFVVGVAMSWVIEPFILPVSFLEAFQKLIQNHGLLLLISFAFSLVATLLRKAKKIEDENKEFY
jgi:hypothetical protein